MTSTLQSILLFWGNAGQEVRKLKKFLKTNKPKMSEKSLNRVNVLQFLRAEILREVAFLSWWTCLWFYFGSACLFDWKFWKKALMFFRHAQLLIIWQYRLLQLCVIQLTMFLLHFALSVVIFLQTSGNNVESIENQFFAIFLVSLFTVYL